MLERVDFFIRDISAIPVADTARIWSRCLNEINYLKNRKNFLVREGYEAERRSRSDEALYAINQIAQLTQAETDERKKLLLQERRTQFQTALHNNPVT
jgi:hypothetical protein